MQPTTAAPRRRQSHSASSCRAKIGRARDATVYGLSQRSTKNFYLHWKQRHARAATLGNARNMLAAVNALKARAARLGATTTGA